MAGIMFTDQSMVLAGYRSGGLITGIGGKREGNELPFQTAIREMLEELFEFDNLSSEVFQQVHDTISSTEVIMGAYTVFMCSFYDLKKILSMLKDSTSKLYDRFPLTIEELVLNRRRDKKCEFTHLVLLPFSPNLRIQNCFLKDISLFLNTV
jgi:hypothetical protein